MVRQRGGSGELIRQLEQRIAFLTPSSQAMEYQDDVEARTSEYKLTQKQLKHLKVVKWHGDWSRVRKAFKEGIEEARIFTLDTESDFRDQKDPDKARTLRLLLIGSLSGPFLLWHLSTWWPRRSREESYLESFLPPDFVKILKDERNVIVGSDVCSDFAKIFPGEGLEWNRFVEIQRVAQLLIEAGVINSLGNRPGLGNIALKLIGYDYKTYWTADDWVKRGYREEDYRDFRNQRKMYTFRRDLNDFQLFYCFLDIAIPIILVMRAVMLTLQKNSEANISSLTPDLISRCLAKILGVRSNTNGQRSMPMSAFDEEQYLKDEEIADRVWQRMQEENAARLSSAFDPAFWDQPSTSAGLKTDTVVEKQMEGQVEEMKARRQQLRDKAERMIFYSGAKVLNGRPTQPSWARQPLFAQGVCWSCGLCDEDCDPTKHAQLVCEYPLCSLSQGDKRPHDTSMCRSLQSVCNNCYLRGHRQFQCDLDMEQQPIDGKSSEVRNERWRLFERWADLGLVTRNRWNNAYLGAFHFYRNGFTKLAKPDKTYVDIEQMNSVEEVEQWIRGYRFEAYEEHAAVMYTSSRKRKAAKRKRDESKRRQEEIAARSSAIDPGRRSERTPAGPSRSTSRAKNGSRDRSPKQYGYGDRRELESKRRQEIAARSSAIDPRRRSERTPAGPSRSTSRAKRSRDRSPKQYGGYGDRRELESKRRQEIAARSSAIDPRRRSERTPAGPSRSTSRAKRSRDRSPKQYGGYGDRRELESKRRQEIAARSSAIDPRRRSERTPAGPSRSTSRAKRSRDRSPKERIKRRRRDASSR